LKKNGSEVSNMLYTEWNWDDALAVRYEEGREEGWEEGREEGREEIARNALVKGIPIDIVSEITGLDIETISRIR
jgi:predicted transposase/invertase (TIGR01784 family)